MLYSLLNIVGIQIFTCIKGLIKSLLNSLSQLSPREPLAHLGKMPTIKLVWRSTHFLQVYTDDLLSFLSCGEIDEEYLIDTPLTQ